MFDDVACTVKILAAQAPYFIQTNFAKNILQSQKTDLQNSIYK